MCMTQVEEAREHSSYCDSNLCYSIFQCDLSVISKLKKLKEVFF